MHLLIGYQNSYNKSNAIVIVSAVPFISAGAFSAIKVDRGESDTTHNTQKSKSKKKVC
jgi:hypothetical protein